MPVKTADGLVHNIDAGENQDRYGKTVCRLSYTAERLHKQMVKSCSLTNIEPVAHTQSHVTCLTCIGRIP